MLAHLATFAGTPCHFASDDGARLYDLSRLRRLPHEFDLIVYNFRVNGADAQFRMNVCADVNAPCEAGAHPAVLISEGRCAPLARLESEVVRERTGGIVRSTTRPLGLVVEYGDGTPCDAQGTPSVVRLQLDCDESVGGLQLVGVERDALCEWTAHARSAAACPLKAAAALACAPGCAKDWVGNGWCEPACLVDGCEKDRGDCDDQLDASGNVIGLQTRGQRIVDAGRPQCVAGERQACACIDGTAGEQACAADGLHLEPCECALGGAAAAADTAPFYALPPTADVVALALLGGGGVGFSLVVVVMFLVVRGATRAPPPVKDEMMWEEEEE